MSKSISFDLAFIGSGISSTYTLLHFLNKLDTKNDSSIYHIAIIEKYPTFHTGIPYGERSGSTTLLITSLKNFLPEPELSEFIPWLNENKDWLLKEFLEEGGPLSLEWIQKHKDALEHNQWGDLFIPRRFFGYYIDNKIKSLTRYLEKENQLKVSYIHDKATDMVQKNGLWEVSFKKQSPIVASKVILAIGSLPTNYLWKNKARVNKEHFLLINDPYKPNLSETLQDIGNFVDEQSLVQQLNIAIIGANASGLEMLYQLNDHPEIKKNIHNFFMLSSQGLLPDSKIDESKLLEYETTNLDHLEKKESIQASDIAEAVYKDLDLAENIQLGAASTVGIISQKFGSLLNKLDYDELEKFACLHGNEIGRRQRCAGEHYSNIAKLLGDEDRFVHIAGRFADLQPTSTGYELIYSDKHGKKQKIEQSVNLVINCIGGMKLSHPKTPKILRNLLIKGIIQANKSGIGIKVNESFEAAENLHIMGPLLAGNVLEDKAVWHVEHCGRIISLSETLSDILFNTIQTSKENNFQLEIIDLEDSEGINAYKSLIKSEWDNNPYYVYEHLSHHKSEENKLLAFNFKVGSKSTVIMPMVMRQIELTKEPLFDIISPYGYSGPLYRNETTSGIIGSFWEAIDEWYKKNNVVSEFVRFHLNGNHEGYSGYCVPTLDNVFGKLMTSFEEQWDSFLPKVRNNYRKAAKADLTIKFYEHGEIDRNHVATFYDIYVSTMKRNGASKSLYFSLEHFENLVLSHKESFSIALVYKGEVAVSTELIIHLEDSMFAYLGGTLADYFDHRPNDFLRVEVIRWCIEKGKSHYILGGGINNGDGLYKFKKSLFPNSTDRIFYTGRKIINLEKYNQLSALAGLPFEGLEEVSYFPVYRKTVV
ncbi:GNAT family N-acetyltransferase [Flagellimonas aequoris]|uniref:GNAT family N-acetyltransferase n=1 Tax=Flagellimonas aequoris TaxID=2306997 RepID=A0A418NCK9_9FLAO|nr:GNAT family N-acetyltransferase [Allomuricauda aequoris]RIV74399.1 GNAT family N-acetyltransferase [Allomuricauda aequoris]TXK08521.1 GNAT family N-acetyltransferase [Allomuricauda aequoris]